MEFRFRIDQLKTFFLNHDWKHRLNFKMMLPLKEEINIRQSCETGNCGCFWRVVTVFFIVVVLLSCGVLYTHLSQVTGGDQANTTGGSLDPQPFSSRTCKVEIEEHIKKELTTLIRKEIESTSKQCLTSSRMSPEQMRNIIKDEIRRQQKSGLKADFASASAGGLILWASPTWTEGYSSIYFLFIPIRSTAPAPSIVLEPTRQAGDCWPMKGTNGCLLIQLAARANIQGFTLEHIDPEMSLSGRTKEAPKNFTVYGIEDPENPQEMRHVFGSYAYNNTNEERQYFKVQNPGRKTYFHIQLEILSNHGNENYTCIYRFQVHGYIDRASHC